MKWLAALLLSAGALAGCGGEGGETEVACSIVGYERFPVVYLEGPAYNPAEFVTATPEGQALEAFFIGGEGEPENQHYVASEGFSVVAQGFVLGYQDGLPFADFSLDGDNVTGWGGCLPNLVSGELVAYRWYPLSPVDRQATTVAVGVEGGGCVTDEGTDVVTEVVSIEVAEFDDRVELVAWTRDVGGDDMCAGVGLQIDAVAELSAPLGDRAMVDAGMIPPVVVEVER